MAELRSEPKAEYPASLLTSNTMALKEWAVVVWALGRGDQILLLRKGGIAEETGEFQVASKEFFLWPTYEHQQSAMLQPSAAAAFHRLKPAGSSRAPLSLQYYAVITDTLPAPELLRMQEMKDAFVWNERFLEKRYAYKPERPLWVLLVRAYALPAPVPIADQDRYAGCRSWVELDSSIPTAGALPVLGEDEFQSRRESLLR